MLTSGRLRRALWGAGIGLCLPAVAAAAPTPVVTYTLPAPAATAFSTSAAYGADGRLYAYDGQNVFREDAVNGPTFTKISTAANPAAGSDAGPITFTRDGSKVVVGTGAGGPDFSGASNGKFFTLPSAGGAFGMVSGSVPYQYSFAPLPAGSTAANAANKLAVDQGTATFDGSSVSYFDLATGANATVVSGIPGATTAVAFDAGGRMYVGVGFGSRQGEIRRFDVAALDAAAAGGTAVPFSDGALLNAANNNSGTGYFVSSAGYLFAGSGSDGGFITVSPQGAVASYNLGASFASIAYNPTNDQFAVFDGNAVAVYPASAFVPEPSAAGIAVVLSAAGLLRRRRRAAA